MSLNLQFHWDFDFQGQFEVDVPSDRRPYLAIAGGILHGDIYGKLAQLFLEEGAIELSRKQDFTRRDEGFTRNKAIRSADLKIVRLIDAKTGTPMRAIPDVVDYRNDLIIDLKTYYLRNPPDDGGIFVVAEVPHDPNTMGTALHPDAEVPNGYEDAWLDLRAMVETNLRKKYCAQLDRYHRAYLAATGRIPSINIYVVLYALTKTYEHENGYGGMRRNDCS